MKLKSLGTGRIVLGVFLAILFLPFFILLPLIGGNTWVVENKVIDSKAMMNVFEEMDGYDRLQDLILNSVVDYEMAESEIVKKVVEEVCNKEFINEAVTQIMDRIFENKDIDIDLQDELEENIHSAILGFYDDASGEILDDWINNNTNGKYEEIYEICDDIIADMMIEYGADELGVDESALNINQVRNYLVENPISDNEKNRILKKCEDVVEEYADDYSAEISEEVNIEIMNVFDELEDSDEMEQVSEIIGKFKERSLIVFVGSIVIFAALFILLLLVFKGNRTAFYLPAISLIISAIVFLAEYLIVVLLLGKLTGYFNEGNEAIEVFAVEYITNYVGTIQNVFLVFAAIMFIIAVVLFIVGTVIHIIRVNNFYKMEVIKNL